MTRPVVVPMLALCLAAVPAALPGAVPSRPQPADALQAWIARQAIPIRSIDPADEDFRDLEPLIGAIGGARVVQLGEPGHGAGSSFAAKVRLIKFLHRRLGFDVVAWESGLHDVRLAQAALGAGGEPHTAAQQGILPVWSAAKEVAPLFLYARASLGTTRPIEMAGFDLQVSAPGSEQRFAADLRSFAAALHDGGRRREVAGLVDQALAAYGRLQAEQAARQGKDGPPPATTDLDAFLSAIDGLSKAIGSSRAAFEAAHGAREVAFMERAIGNLHGRGVSVYERLRTGPESPAARASDRWNRRDTAMAANLRWLVETAYPDRKVIVWAHNAHVANVHFSADWRSVHAQPQPDGMTAAGVSIAAWLKDAVYTIATTTYEGEDAWANGQRRGAIAPAPDGSLESRLHALGKPQVFLDLRSASGDRHPVRVPLSMRVSGYGPPSGQYGNDVLPDPASAFDAVFFIDRMAPATRIAGG